MHELEFGLVHALYSSGGLKPSFTGLVLMYTSRYLEPSSHVTRDQVRGNRMVLVG